MEEGLLPHARAVAEGGVEEERRLAYVGITRAMTTLTLTWAFERAKYGRRAASVPSRFLFEAQGEAPPEGWVGIEADGGAGRRRGRRAAQGAREEEGGREAWRASGEGRTSSSSARDDRAADRGAGGFSALP